MDGPQSKTGLYDPRFEHDACGVGFVADLNNVRSHDVVRKGIDILINLDHRGARGAEPDSGDGAGILVQLPHAFFLRECSALGMALPEPGDYAIGQCFLPRDRGTHAGGEARLRTRARRAGPGGAGAGGRCPPTTAAWGPQRSPENRSASRSSSAVR